DAYYKEWQPAKLRELLKTTFKNEEVTKFVEKASDNELRKMVWHLRKGVHFATPVFDGATERDIQEMLKIGGLPELGRTTLFHGVTGEPFSEEVTVGVMYMLKLHHLVEEKIH